MSDHVFTKLPSTEMGKPDAYAFTGNETADDIWLFLRGLMHVEEVTLDNTKLLDLNNDKDILDAPGEGKVIEFCGAVLRYSYGDDTSYGGGGNLTFEIGGETVSTAIGQDFIVGSADGVAIAAPISYQGLDTTLVNEKLELTIATSLNGGHADNELSVKVFYRVHEL